MQPIQLKGFSDFSILPEIQWEACQQGDLRQDWLTELPRICMKLKGQVNMHRYTYLEGREKASSLCCLKKELPKNRKLYGRNWLR